MEKPKNQDRNDCKIVFPFGLHILVFLQRLLLYCLKQISVIFLCFESNFVQNNLIKTLLRQRIILVDFYF